MKKILLILFAFATIVAKTQTTTWVQRTPGYVFGSVSTLPVRNFGVSFSIGTSGFVATGEGVSTLTSALSDCWEYVPQETFDLWQQKADVPGGGRTQAFGFAIGSKGYVGGGSSLTSPFGKSDFYSFNPSTNTWAALAGINTTTVLGGAYIPVRIGSASFVYSGNGFVAGGGLSLHNTASSIFSVIQYNPTTGLWSSGGSLPLIVYDGTGFAVGGNAYVTCGNGHGMSYNPTLKYNGSSWTNLSIAGAFPGQNRSKPVSFVLGNRAYAGLGYSNTASGSDLTDIRVFDPSTDTWSCSATTFPGGNRQAATAMSVTVGGVGTRVRAFVQNGATGNGISGFTPVNTNYEYQPIYFPNAIPNICTPTVLGIPFYKDCGYPAGTVFTAQLCNYLGGTLTVVTTLGTATASPFTLNFPNVFTPTGLYMLRIIASQGPVLISNISNFFTIYRTPATPTALSGPSSICAGSKGVFFHNESYVTATGSAGTFVWGALDGNTSILNSANENFVIVPPNTNYKNSATILGVSPGVSKIFVYASDPTSGCTSPITTITTTVLGAPAIPTITGPAQICTNTPSYYSVGSQASVTFKWGLTGPGTINNAIVNLATVTGTAPGILQLVVTAGGSNCTVTSAMYPVTVTSPYGTPPATFSGPGAICNGSTAVYSQVITFTGSFPNVFTWSVSNSNATLLGYSTDFISYDPVTFIVTLKNSATITGLNNGTVQLNIYQSAYAGACPSAPTSRTITITGAPPTITGPSSISICTSLPGIYSMVSVSGQTYSWSISGANGSLLYSNNVSTLTGLYGTGITLTGMTSGLCPSSVDKYIPFVSCCDAPSYPATISGGVSTSQSYSGSYYVDADLVFNGGTQTFTPGTAFYVAPEVSITFVNGTVANIISTKFTSASCSTMWNGIMAGDNSVFNFNGSELSNSENGLYNYPYLSYSYVLTVTNSLFNNNYKQHISTRDNNSLSGISNSTFTGNPVTMLAPYNYTSAGNSFYTEVGIRTIKSPLISNCYFNNCLLGVANTDWDYFTVFSITGSTFTNCQIAGIMQFSNDCRITSNKITVPGQLTNIQMPFHTDLFGNFNSTVNYGIYSYGSNEAPLATDVNRLYSNTIIGNNTTQTGAFMYVVQQDIANNYFINLNKGIDNQIVVSSMDAVNYYYGTILNITANLFKDCNNSLTLKLSGGSLTTIPYLPINCNGFTKTVSFTGTTLGIIIADGFDNNTQNIGASTTSPAGNKFSSGFNKPLVMNDGSTTAWTYYSATDENTGGTVYGSAPAKLSINTGSTKTAFQACGYNPPAREEAFGESADVVGENSLSVYPNPFSDELNVQFNSEEGKIYAIELINSIGISVYNTSVRSVGISTKVLINSPVNGGIYLVKITDGTVTRMAKVVKK